MFEKESDVAILFDVEGPILEDKKTFLTEYGYLNLAKASPIHRPKWAIGGAVLEAIIRIAPRVLPNNYEKPLLEAYGYVLKHFRPSEADAKALAKDYAKRPVEGSAEFLRQTTADTYLISTGYPRNALESLYEEQGLEGKFAGVAANTFLIEAGKIIGWDEETCTLLDRYGAPIGVPSKGLLADSDGKRNEAQKVRDIGYSTIIAIGNGRADKGMIELADIGLTYENADPALKKYVMAEFGPQNILPRPEDIFPQLSDFEKHGYSKEILGPYFRNHPKNDKDESASADRG
ncbi:MAG: hypothetical protein JW727_05630 [Candidatus Aenigmarchaeota archaeon]|nr:hypothetical protein [Candidatus Aenigmarchaeota archaeon]